MQQRVNKESIPVGSTLRFLGHTMVAGSALFAIWIYLGPLYLASLVPPLNGLAGQADAALNFAQHRDILALSFRQLDNSWHHLRLIDHFQFNMLAAMAVFLATPRTSLRWKLGWAGVLLAFFWTTHIGNYFLGGYVGIWNYLDALPHARQQILMARGWDIFLNEYAQLWCAIFGLWNMWISPALVLLVWFFATQPRLHSPAHSDA